MNKRPNFILFVTDQQPAGLLGCEGQPLARTPALDALAAQGCLFDAFHVATPLCQPNRATLNALVTYLHDQHLVDRVMDVDDLFVQVEGGH